MTNSHQCEILTASVLKDIDINKIMADASLFSKLHRYSGSPGGEKAVDIIMAGLEEAGITAVRENYELYRSLPLSAQLTVTQGEKRAVFSATPFVYSGSTPDLEAPVIFDAHNKTAGWMEQAGRFENFKGNLVFTYDTSYEFACLAKEHGAAGIITTYPLDIPHHGTIGGVWGTPEPSDLAYRYPGLPYVELLQKDGNLLLAMLQNGGVCGRLNVKMDTGVVRSSMPIATIPGKSEKFVLISGHYDSWYEGMTDNGVANVAMLEMARVFHRHRRLLNRTLVFAWWSGHSDGRYAGSTWYMDHHFQQLKKNCVAHLNMDICGCKGSDLVAFTTAMLEGPGFNNAFLSHFNHHAPEPPTPMRRFADQTFWGCHIPFAIMPKFGVSDKRALSYDWWHTPEDTLDKVDPQVALRDSQVIAKLICLFSLLDPLPVDYKGFLTFMETTLKEIDRSTTEDFDLSQVFSILAQFRQAAFELAASMSNRNNTDDIVKAVYGELLRITYTYSSAYHHDNAVNYGIFPMLAQAKGKTPENTTPEYYLALKTNFVRQANRLAGQMNNLLQAIEFQLLKWRLE